MSKYKVRPPADWKDVINMFLTAIIYYTVIVAISVVFGLVITVGIF